MHTDPYPSEQRVTTTPNDFDRSIFTQLDNFYTGSYYTDKPKSESLKQVQLIIHQLLKLYQENSQIFFEVQNLQIFSKFITYTKETIQCEDAKFLETLGKMESIRGQIFCKIYSSPAIYEEKKLCLPHFIDNAEKFWAILEESEKIACEGNLRACSHYLTLNPHLLKQLAGNKTPSFISIHNDDGSCFYLSVILIKILCPSLLDAFISIENSPINLNKFNTTVQQVIQFIYSKELKKEWLEQEELCHFIQASPALLQAVDQSLCQELMKVLKGNLDERKLDEELYIFWLISQKSLFPQLKLAVEDQLKDQIFIIYQSDKKEIIRSSKAELCVATPYFASFFNGLFAESYQQAIFTTTPHLFFTVAFIKGYVHVEINEENFNDYLHLAEEFGLKALKEEIEVWLIQDYLKEQKTLPLSVYLEIAENYQLHHLNFHALTTPTLHAKDLKRIEQLLPYLPKELHKKFQKQLQCLFFKRCIKWHLIEAKMTQRGNNWTIQKLESGSCVKVKEPYYQGQDRQELIKKSAKIKSSFNQFKALKNFKMENFRHYLIHLKATHAPLVSDIQNYTIQQKLELEFHTYLSLLEAKPPLTKLRPPLSILLNDQECIEKIITPLKQFFPCLQKLDVRQLSLASRNIKIIFEVLDNNANLKKLIVSFRLACSILSKHDRDTGDLLLQDSAAFVNNYKTFPTITTLKLINELTIANLNSICHLHSEQILPNLEYLIFKIVAPSEPLNYSNLSIDYLLDKVDWQLFAQRFPQLKKIHFDFRKIIKSESAPDFKGIPLQSYVCLNDLSNISHLLNLKVIRISMTAFQVEYLNTMHPEFLFTLKKNLEFLQENEKIIIAPELGFFSPNWEEDTEINRNNKRQRTQTEKN